MKKIYCKLNSKAPEVIDQALTDKFGDCGFKTEWNLLAMTLVTKWSKKIPIKLKKEIKIYVNGFSDGYSKAMNIV